MRSVIKKAIEKNKNDGSPNVQNLFEDILLSHHHAFGNHMQCKSYFCNSQTDSQTDFFSGSLWQRICLLIQNIAAHARSLIHDVNSNIVERFHSIIAKYIGGKELIFLLCNHMVHDAILRLLPSIHTNPFPGCTKIFSRKAHEKKSSC